MSNKRFFPWGKKALWGGVSALALVLSLVSCNPGIAEVQDAQLQLQEGAGLQTRYALPLASERELLGLTKNGDGTLDYRIARKTAIIEFETGYRASLDWTKGVRLSERPVVVYNADSKPEIYEFFVLQEGRPIGTVSTYAHTTYPEIIRNVLPFVRDYKPYTTKYAGYKQVADYYPLSVYVGVVSKSGGEVRNVIDPRTGKRKAPPRIPKPSVEPKEIQNAKAVAKIYWKIVLEHADEILKMTDEELYAKLETKAGNPSNAVYAKKFEGFKKPATHAPARTIWSGWCVPSALAELVWVWGDGKYKGVTLPDVSDNTFPFSFSYKEYINGKAQYWKAKLRVKNGNTGAYEFYYDIEGKRREYKNGNKPLVNLDAIKAVSKKIDNGLYYDIINAYGVGSNWSGGMYIRRGAQAVKKVTNNKISYRILRNWRLLRNMNEHITENKRPVIDGIRTSKKGGHARLLIGTISFDWNAYVLRESLCSSSSSSSSYSDPNIHFLIWDNGHDTKPHGYMPYWESSTAVSRDDAVGFTY